MQKLGHWIDRLMWRFGWQRVPEAVWTREKEHVPFYNSSKLTVCVDFDGVINSYTSGWKGAANLPDPPVEGAIEWLNKLDKRYSVAILTTRAQTQEACDAIADYLVEHGYTGSMPLITDRKIPALIYVDDRAVRFDGPEKGFPAIDTISTMQPWNKKYKHTSYHYGGDSWKGHTGKIAEKHSALSGGYGQKGQIKIERVVTDLGDGKGERQIAIPYCDECGRDAVVKFKNYFDCPDGHCHRRADEGDVKAYEELLKVIPKDQWGNMVVPGDPDRDDPPKKKQKKGKGQQKLPGMGTPKGRTGGKPPKQIAAAGSVAAPMGEDATAEDMENWTDEEFDAWMRQEDDAAFDARMRKQGLLPYYDEDTDEVIYLSPEELDEVREMDLNREKEAEVPIEINIEPDEQQQEQQKEPKREEVKPENDPQQPKPQPVEQPNKQ
jgi:hypothetical protein